MNTQQINAILFNDAMTKHMFQGVCSIDQLPLTCNGMVVVNTDEQDQPGEHQIAVYDNEYFDSYGLPSQKERLWTFIGSNVAYNNVPLQQVMSNSCGFYCVYVLLECACGHSFEDIVHMLRNSGNDFIVKNMGYDRYLPLFY